MEEKRTDIQLYIFAHKNVPYGIWDNALYTPLQVGAALNEPICDVRDNQGDNISEWNKVYVENTGAYWIWKNRPASLKYVGQMQYRRRIQFDQDMDFDEWFSKYDVTTMIPVKYNGISVGDAYKGIHSQADIDLAREILSDIHPEYVKTFNKAMAGDLVFYSNGFLMTSENYDRYNEWLFSILDEFRDRSGWKDPETAILKLNAEIITGRRGGRDASGERWGGDTFRYQRQVFGFLSERLLTTWLLHNIDPRRIYCKKYLLMEDTKI